jgi:hypothetical protein
LSRPAPFQPAEPEPLLDGAVVRDIRSAGIGLLVARMKALTKRRLDESGLSGDIGEEHFHPTVRAAVKASGMK